MRSRRDCDDTFSDDYSLSIRSSFRPQFTSTGKKSHNGDSRAPQGDSVIMSTDPNRWENLVVERDRRLSDENDGIDPKYWLGPAYEQLSVSAPVPPVDSLQEQSGDDFSQSEASGEGMENFLERYSEPVSPMTTEGACVTSTAPRTREPADSRRGESENKVLRENRFLESLLRDDGEEDSGNWPDNLEITRLAYQFEELKQQQPGSDAKQGDLPNKENGFEVQDHQYVRWLRSLAQLDPSRRPEDFEVTRLAHELENIKNQKPKENINPSGPLDNARRAPPPRCSPANSSGRRSSPSILSDRQHLLWVGVSLIDANVKTMTLTLNHVEPVKVRMSITQDQSVFYFTDKHGKHGKHAIEATLHPKKDSEIHIRFRPVDTSNQSGVVLVEFHGRKYRVQLFGYAEAARITLSRFEARPDPARHDKEHLVCRMEEASISIKRDVAATKIDIVNVTARAAYVAFFTEQHVQFQPRALIVNSNSTRCVSVTWTCPGGVMPAGISFSFIYADEPLRQACRQSFSNLPGNRMYHFLTELQLFSLLPDEEKFTLIKLPQFDWRSHLTRQVRDSCRSGLIEMTRACRAEIGAGESALTIGRRANSLLTEVSSLSIVKNLQLGPTVRRGIKALNTSTGGLENIIVLQDMITFAPTPVGSSSYQAILIRNLNPFPVQFKFSSIIRCSPFSRHGSNGARVLTASTDTGVHDSSSSSGEAGMFPLTGASLCNSARTIRLELDPLVQCVPAAQSLLVPVSFRPVAADLIQSSCTVRFQRAHDDLFYEREIDFSGEGVTKVSTRSALSRQPQTASAMAGISLSASVLDFGETSSQRRACLPIELRSDMDHPVHLFISPLQPPFEMSSGGRVTLTAGRVQLRVYFNPAAASTPLSRGVLLFSDDQGHCNQVLLEARLSRPPVAAKR